LKTLAYWLALKRKTTFLVPPFPFVKEDKNKDEKPKATDIIEFLLKQRADSNATASTKTLKVKGFAKGLLHNGLNSVKEFPSLEAKQHNHNAGQDSEYHKHSTQNLLTILGEKIQELTTSTNKGEIEFTKITDETVTASLNAVAHMVFSKERFMTKCEVIEANKPKSSFKNNNSVRIKEP
jgi:uncharacterized protein (DUF885 family)